MLMPDDVHPKYTLVYNGALILQVLRDNGACDLMDLYIGVREHGEVGLPLLLLSLDWLFLADCITHNDHGNFITCS